MNNKNKIFSSGHWEYNACLNFSRHQEVGYIDGYRKAANILVDYIKNETRNQDYLVYPIIFLYRHHLELRIKDIIEKSCELFDLPLEREKYSHHNLKKLWNICKHNLGRIHQYKETFNKIESVVNDIDQIDDGSFSFRYPRDKKGNNCLDSEIKVINIEVLFNYLDEVFCLLEGANEEIIRLSDIKNELSR